MIDDVNLASELNTPSSNITFRQIVSISCMSADKKVYSV